MNLFKHIFIYLFLAFSLYANTTIVKDLSKLSANSLYNLDEEQIVIALKPYMLQHTEIKAIKIIDNTDNSIFMTLSYKNNKITYGKKLQNNYTNFLNTQSDINYENEDIGKIIVYYTKTNNLNLSNKEIAFIQKQTPIKYVYDSNWKPFEFKNEINEHDGMIAEILQIIKNKTNLNFVPIKVKSWKEAKALIKNKKADMFSGVSQNKKREKKLNFSKESILNYNAVLIGKDTNICKDFRKCDKRIGIKKGYILTDFIKKNYSNLTIIDIKSTADGFKSIENNQIDFYLNNSVVANYYINHKGFENLKVIKELDYEFNLKIAIRKELPIVILNIIDKALASISTKKKKDIYNSWIKNNKKVIKVNLTDKEKQWIINNIVTVGVEPWSPIIFSNDGKKIGGISGEFIKIISKKTGLKYKIISNKWDDLVEKFRNKQIDIIPTAYYNNKRAKIGLFSDPYFKVKDAIHINVNNKSVENLKDLEGKTLAILKGHAIISKIHEKYPKIKLVYTSGLNENINLLLDKKVDAFYESQISVQIKINEELIKGIKSIVIQEFKIPQLYFWIKKDESILYSIIQKGLKTISYQDKIKISSKWIANKNNNIELSDNEMGWLEKNKVIKYVYDVHREPFEYKNDLGVHSGITADILNLISQKTSMQFKALETNNWDEANNLIKSKKSDMFSFVIENNDRNKYLNFTNKTLFKVPVVFITNKDDNKIYENIKFDLINKTIGVVKGRAIYKKLIQKYPKLNFVLLDSLDEGFGKIENKDIDLLAVNKSTSKYYIKIKGYDDTKIGTSIDIFFEFKIALQKDLAPEILSIINKALDNISEVELNEIYNRYMNVQIKQKTNWVFLGKIGGIVLLIIIFMIWNNYRLNKIVKEKTKDILRQKEEIQQFSLGLELKVQERTSEIKKQKEEFETIYNGTKDSLAILDMKSKFLQVNPAYCEMTGYSEDELLNNTCFNLTVEEDKETSAKAVQEILKVGFIKNFEKACIIKDSKIIQTNMSMSLLENPQRILISVRDITQQKKMEKEIQQRTKELEGEKKLISSIINSQDSIVATSNGKTLKTINQAFIDFYGLSSVDEFEKKYGSCICDSFEVDVPIDYLKKDMNGTLWVLYMLDRANEKFKVIIKKDDIPHIFTISLDSFIFEENKYVTVVLNDITEVENAKKEIEAIHRHTRDSIEYASLIQGALIPQEGAMAPYFKDHFVTWIPKDTVGGDIWLFNQLRHKDECLLLFIDCTGHGVAGAFVTMIVKAVEREITTMIKANKNMEVSPAWIMGYFNNAIKNLLRQETKDSLSNAGWDGGIIYYNRRTQILKFAGAETPLFYMTKDEEFKTIKGNRYSVGYKKCAFDYEYKETIIEVEEGMKFYCTTDGYLDQNGGEKDFPFGKKRFGNIIKEYHKESMAEQQNIFMMEMMEYESIIPNNDRNDDMTVIAFEIDKT